MSLINEALKKAQRQRNEESAEAAPTPGGGRIAKRGQARSANTMLLLGAGALGLVIVSVVATVYFINRPSAPAPAVVAQTPAKPSLIIDDNPMAAPSVITPPAIPAAAKSPPTNSAAANPVMVTAAPNSTATAAKATGSLAESKAPPLTDPAPSTARSHASSPAAAAPIAARAESTAPAPTTFPAPLVPAADTAKPDERIYQYVDALRITGVKAAGNDSRVLMNDRVYRLNDIVERTLGVRLVKVETNTLTFTDANGAVYVKNF